MEDKKSKQFLVDFHYTETITAENEGIALMKLQNTLQQMWLSIVQSHTIVVQIPEEED